MTNTREIQYVCTPFFCRRNVLSFEAVREFSSPIVVPAEQFDFFAVVMADTLDGYTMFDDRIIDSVVWNEFLFTASEYLSWQSYDGISERVADWLKINGEIFCREKDTYSAILSYLIEWSLKNVGEDGVLVKGI